MATNLEIFVIASRTGRLVRVSSHKCARAPIDVVKSVPLRSIVGSPRFCPTIDIEHRHIDNDVRGNPTWIEFFDCLDERRWDEGGRQHERHARARVDCAGVVGKKLQPRAS